MLAGGVPNAILDTGTPHGLGDVIADFTHTTGIDRLSKAYEEVTGTDCGCDARQRKLNALFPLTPAA